MNEDRDIFWYLGNYIPLDFARFWSMIRDEVEDQDLYKVMKIRFFLQGVGIIVGVHLMQWMRILSFFRVKFLLSGKYT